MERVLRQLGVIASEENPETGELIFTTKDGQQYSESAINEYLSATQSLPNEDSFSRHIQRIADRRAEQNDMDLREMEDYELDDRVRREDLANLRDMERTTNPDLGDDYEEMRLNTGVHNYLNQTGGRYHISADPREMENNRQNMLREEQKRAYSPNKRLSDNPSSWSHAIESGVQDPDIYNPGFRDWYDAREARRKQMREAQYGRD